MYIIKIKIGLKLLFMQEEVSSTLRIAKKISEEESKKAGKFTEEIKELMKDIFDDPKCLATKMLEDYMDIVKLRREFSKHPPLQEERLVYRSTATVFQYCCWTSLFTPCS